MEGLQENLLKLVKVFLIVIYYNNNFIINDLY